MENPRGPRIVNAIVRLERAGRDLKGGLSIAAIFQGIEVSIPLAVVDSGWAAYVVPSSHMRLELTMDGQRV